MSGVPFSCLEMVNIFITGFISLLVLCAGVKSDVTLLRRSVLTDTIAKSINAYQRFRTSHITRVGTLIVATIYLQLIQNRYVFRSFTVLHCSHQYCIQPVASDVEVVGYL